MKKTNKDTIRLAGINPQTKVNGPGVRRLYFSQGCIHHCKECFNPETWDLNGGKLVPIQDILNDLENDADFLDGITLGGGDPMEQPDKFIAIAKKAKELKLNVWSYTGYTWEELVIKAKTNKAYNELFKYIDAIVDGRFVVKLLNSDPDFKFRGSTNQRIIDVQKSLKEKKIVKLAGYK